MTTKQTWGGEIQSISSAIATYCDFASCSDAEIERAVRGEEFSAAEVLTAFAGVAVEEITGTIEIKGANGRDLGGECDWSELAA